jgi:hypothetical protein
MTLSTLYFGLHKKKKKISVKPRCEKFAGTNHFTSKYPGIRVIRAKLSKFEQNNFLFRAIY